MRTIPPGSTEKNTGLNEFDNFYWQSNIRLLCGIDEAGRGALAGPVVAAAVIFNAGDFIAGVNDSKRLTPDVREALSTAIISEALSYGIGQADAAEVDRLNILQATFLAMKRAVDQLSVIPQFILVDGRDFPAFTYRKQMERLPGKAVIKGDARSHCIAAASILAKVHRDRLMKEWHVRFPVYQFDRHKGYGTEIHRKLVTQAGPCPLHRKSFIKKLVTPDIGFK